MRKKFITAALVVAVLTLSGCKEAVQYRLDEVVMNLKDGRKVTCIVKYHHGMSCDWANAH